MSQQRPVNLQAKDGWHFDYWITRDGIYRVLIISNLLGTLSSFATIPILLVIVVFYPDLDQSFLEYVLLGAVMVGSLLCTRFPPLLAGWKRKRMGAYFPRQKGDKKIMQKIEWSSVERATLTRGRDLRVRTGGKDSRMSIDESTAEPVKTLFRSKIGKKFVSRD